MTLRLVSRERYNDLKRSHRAGGYVVQSVIVIAVTTALDQFEADAPNRFNVFASACLAELFVKIAYMHL